MAGRAQVLNVVAVVGSVADGHTDRLVAQVLNAAAQEGATTTTIYLGHGPLDPALIDEQLERVACADAIVLGTPMYRATYAGVLKEFLDRLHRGSPPDGFASAIRAKPVGVVATGGSDHHFLGVDPLINLPFGSSPPMWCRRPCTGHPRPQQIAASRRRLPGWGARSSRSGRRSRPTAAWATRDLKSEGM